jgi:POT family proton-dependent oligopeptide transporter
MQGQLNQHPASLKTFFITEMWERYGFYVVQSLLALFLAFSHLAFHIKRAQSIH